jgi:hypothetical protein
MGVGDGAGAAVGVGEGVGDESGASTLRQGDGVAGATPAANASRANARDEKRVVFVTPIAAASARF